MYFYEMEHCGSFKEAAGTAVLLSDVEFLALLRLYRFYSSDDRCGKNSFRYLYLGGPEKAFHDGYSTWLIACSLPKSKWRF